MASTFNPNEFTRSDFEMALDGGKKYWSDKVNIVDPMASTVSAMSQTVAEISTSLETLTGNFDQHVYDNGVSFSEVNTKINEKFEALRELIEEIIYKGSNNQLDLSNSTFSVVPSDVDVTFDNGVITFTKASTTQDPWVITISGIAIEAGTYYMSTGDDLGTSRGMVMNLYDDNGDRVAGAIYNDEPMASCSFTLSADVTDGSIQIGIQSGYWDPEQLPHRIVPTMAKYVYDKEFSMPKFSPLSGV